MTLIKEIELKDGGKFQVHADENPESPRTWDNLGSMVCFHKRYDLGDRHGYCKVDFNSWDELQVQIEKNNKVVDILPIYMYDHSGLTINTTGFSCPWDSGQIGFIFATVQDVRENYAVKHITKKVREQVRQGLLAEVEVYDQFLSGQVYGFVLEDKDGEHVDSCWGFYGDLSESGMLDHLQVETRVEVEAAL